MTASAGAVVIGIGNVFRRDDGAGPAVLALLRQRARRRPLPGGTTLHECDGDPGRLMELWTDAPVAVVVDAFFPPSPHPGRVHRWCPAPDALPDLPQAGRHSTHGLGLLETLRLARMLGRCPAHLVVYACEGAEHGIGTGLTPPVARAVRPLAERIEQDLQRHAETTGLDRQPHADIRGTRRNASTISHDTP